MSTLCKKAFSAAPVKVVFPQSSNNSDFVVFGNVAFGEIKGHSLITIDFLKVFFIVNVFSRHLTSVRKYLVG